MVDYLSWPESELDEKLVVTSFEDFHKALDSLNSRLKDTHLKVNVNIKNIPEKETLLATVKQPICSKPDKARPERKR